MTVLINTLEILARTDALVSVCVCVCVWGGGGGGGGGGYIPTDTETILLLMMLFLSNHQPFQLHALKASNHVPNKTVPVKRATEELTAVTVVSLITEIAVWTSVL